jgi:hypothetical protein
MRPAPFQTTGKGASRDDLGAFHGAGTHKPPHPALQLFPLPLTAPAVLAPSAGMLAAPAIRWDRCMARISLNLCAAPATVMLRGRTCTLSGLETQDFVPAVLRLTLADPRCLPPPPQFCNANSNKCCANSNFACGAACCAQNTEQCDPVTNTCCELQARAFRGLLPGRPTARLACSL